MPACFLFHPFFFSRRAWKENLSSAQYVPPATAVLFYFLPFQEGRGGDNNAIVSDAVASSYKIYHKHTHTQLVKLAAGSTCVERAILSPSSHHRRCWPLYDRTGKSEYERRSVVNFPPPSLHRFTRRAQFCSHPLATLPFPYRADAFPGAVSPTPTILDAAVPRYTHFFFFCTTPHFWTTRAPTERRVCVCV